MSTVDPQVQVQSQESVEKDEMDWDAYAEHYDEMCALNPAYQANIDILLSHMKNWTLGADSKICDLGAGTGNYIVQMADAFPDAQYWHVDIDHRMTELARQKYERCGVRNVHVVESDVHAANFAKDSFDVVVCVNALYAFTSQESILKRIRSWLKPEGKLFLIDFGRKQKTLDWTLYIFKESMKSQKIGRFTRALIEGRELLKQNRKTTMGQESGRYWLHTTQEFGKTLENSGFKVEELSRCYRNYSDLAVCSK